MRSWTGAMPVTPAAPCAPCAPVAPFGPCRAGWAGRAGLRLTDVAHRWLTARGSQETAQRRCGTTEVLSANYTCHLVSSSLVKLLATVLSYTVGLLVYRTTTVALRSLRLLLLSCILHLQG